MASGPDPPNPDLSESHVAKTVNTSIKVTNISIPKACPADIPVPGVGVQSSASVVAFDDRPLRTPAPITAPSVCTTTYSSALRR